jgi:MoCo/4Fe-4S cofactor protein with predicted Tat translocation signal
MKTNTPKTYWRSLNELAKTPEFIAQQHLEFPKDASELSMTDMSRRSFLGLLGASMALAGATLSGCIRKPIQKILPYTKRPEDLIPGKPKYFATSAKFGSGVQGLLVESHEGRPTKIEGNPQHPMSQGKSTVWAQSAILDLYDPDRSKNIRQSGNAVSWDKYDFTIKKHLETYSKNKGTGLGLLVEQNPSPTFQNLLSTFQDQYPKAKIYRGDETYPAFAEAGLALLGANQVLPSYNFEKADVILSLDCDFLGIEGDTLKYSREYSNRRRIKSQSESMNRLYVVEPGFTSTGASADHRLRLKGSQIFDFLVALSSALFKKGISFPDGSESIFATLNSIASKQVNSGDINQWATVVAKDLINNKKKSLIITGYRQPSWVHALSTLLNTALQNNNKTITFHKSPYDINPESLQSLSTSLKQKSITTLFMIGTNPACDAPFDLELTSLISKIPTSVHLSDAVNETSNISTWHIPRSHFLEAWGDHYASDGSSSLQQPLIAPLHNTSVSDIEFLSHLLGNSKNGYDSVKATWKNHDWRKGLHKGVIDASAPKPYSGSFKWTHLVPVLKSLNAKSSDLEINFSLDTKVLDGRFANNAWLQELPDPMTKLTWENAALISPTTAKSLTIKSGDVIKISVKDRSLRIPALISPGVADETLMLALGYGRTHAGRIGNDVGVNVNQLRSASNPYVESGATLQKTNTHVKLAITQDHHSMEGRALVREASLKHYKEEPNFVQKQEVMPASKIKSLYTEPNKKDGQQWGMAIDLNTCTGCNACTIACQSENNIPVVGKTEVLNGREMHWIRLDRYFNGEVENPESVFQPVPCMQCENAPCETVCPVAATSHSPEGLNDMAYNRCIGTRYCSNNCSYKVRRFNYFNYAKRSNETSPLISMQANPDVTVRFRGVMEKCTYCVQRINSAKADVHRIGEDFVTDGAIKPACAQACPANAIVLGDINDKNSEVFKLKKQNKNYALLSELNTKPRTTYLAKIRNLNPELTA